MNSKKPFEHIDDKIKQAADNYLPAFDEKAWQAMEAKLDDDKKKRRPVLWWFILPLLLAGGAWGGYQLLEPYAKEITNVNAKTNDKTDKNETITINSNKNSSVVADEKNNLPAADDEQDKITGSADNKLNEANKNSMVANNQNAKKEINSKSFKDHSYKKIRGKNKGRLSTQFSGGAVANAEMENIEEGGMEIDKEKNDVVKDSKVPAGINDIKTVDKELAVNTKSELLQPQNKEEKKLTAIENEKKQVEKKTEKEKNKGSNSGFYVLATGGADAGSTKFASLKNSNVTPKYGVGIGYQFNKKWSVQTGFYAANKKYVAGPADYKIKQGSPMGIYPLEKIKASNLVFEIPLQLRYNFISNSSFSMYATAGASSYILQEENYDCFYRYYDNVYEHNWQYKGNKHLFSTAIFSVGIEKNISSKFSILAEPSFSIPISGVGDGAVKLYSASLQAGIKYYLFKRK